MTSRMIWTAGLVALAGVGCAEGVTADPFVFDSGLYELATVGMEGDCVLEDAISAGNEYVGNVQRVGLAVSDTSVTMTVCDDFFPDDCMPESFIEPISMVRDGDSLLAQQPSWPVPGCLCFEDYLGSREVDGQVVEDGKAELRWTFTLPAPPAGCTCAAVACSAMVSQRLLVLGD